MLDYVGLRRISLTGFYDGHMASFCEQEMTVLLQHL